MANKLPATLVKFEHDAYDQMSDRLAQLREEMATITDILASLGSDSLRHARHGAHDLARQVSKSTAVAARQVSRQASTASHVVRENPLPVIAVVATLALLTTLILKDD